MEIDFRGLQDGNDGFIPLVGGGQDPLFFGGQVADLH
jgi:hypothetical protein